MKAFFIFLFVVFFCSTQKSAATVVVTPGKEETVNYTVVLFEVPRRTDVDSYAFEIRLADVTKGKGRLLLKDRKNYFLVKDALEFGRTYLWRYIYYDNAGKELFASEDNILNIRGSKLTNYLLYENRVNRFESKKELDGYISLDHGIITDRQGRVVWSFPDDKREAVRDLKLNEDGNITFIYGPYGYETDLKGNILWRSPDTINGYKVLNVHHELRKLDNGNFLTIGERRKDNKENGRMYSFVFEVDRDNKLQWVWDEEKAFAHDSVYREAHLNAAYYNEKEKMLYISNRDLNSIAKIDVRSGKIVWSVGYDYKDGSIYYSQDFFHAQHAISELPDGNILLFNNAKPQTPSSVQIISQPTTKKAPVMVWEYVFNFDNPFDNYVTKMGDVQPLPNGDLLMCMGGNGKVVEIDMDKKPVWALSSVLMNPGTIPPSPLKLGYRSDFTPSLYPCYFMAYTEAGKLVIENGGTETDSYTCRFMKNGKLVKTIETKPLNAGAQYKIKMPDADEVEIVSNVNKALSRVLKL